MKLTTFCAAWPIGFLTVNPHGRIATLTRNAFTCAALFRLLLIIIACIRRVCFHPLTKFSGPRTASFTAWYGFYFDVVKGGVGIKRFPSLHQRYGNLYTQKSGKE